MVFSTGRGTFRGDGGDMPGVLRRLVEVVVVVAAACLQLFNRERHALAGAPLGGRPPLLYADDTKLVRGLYPPGARLEHRAALLRSRLFPLGSRGAARVSTRARISHNDLANDQTGFAPRTARLLLDFQLASVFQAAAGLFLAMAAREYLRPFSSQLLYIPSSVRRPSCTGSGLSRALPTRIWI